MCNFMVKYGYEQRPQFTSSTNNPTCFISQYFPIFIENDVVIENIEIISQVGTQIIVEEVVVAVEEVPVEEVPVEEVRSATNVSLNVIEVNNNPIKKNTVKKRFKMWF